MQPLQGPSDPLLIVLSPKRCQMTRSAVVMHQFNASTLEISSIYSSIPFYITSVALQPICLESTAYNIYFRGLALEGGGGSAWVGL